MLSLTTALMGFLLLSGISADAQTLDAYKASSYPVTLTAYNAVPGQTDSTPLETASGAYSNPEVVAARSRDLREELPFGTIIEIDGPTGPNNSCGYHVVSPIIGYRVIADTMNARYTNRIDILFNVKSNYIVGGGVVKNAGNILGICEGSSIKVVGHVNINKIPKTQKELAMLVNGSNKTVALK